MKKYILSIVVLLLLALNSIAQKPVKYIKSDKYEGVIFSEPKNIMIVDKSNPLYIPSEMDIAKMEKKLSSPTGKSFLLLNNRDLNYQYPCDFVNSLPEYKRYYFGNWINNEKVIITFFFITRPDNTDWKKSYFLIEDGGCAYFRVVYSVKSGSFSRLDIGAFF
jgi:hypothetical protein